MDPTSSAPSICHNNLCVTSQHEDEGYLSPSEEDLLRFNSQIKRTAYLDCNKAQSGSNAHGASLISHNPAFAESVDNDNDNEVPWEVIARMPDINHQYLSWDRLQLPVPFRFFDSHRLCLHQIRKNPTVSYLTDKAEEHPKVIENIWRSCFLEQTQTFQKDDGDDCATTIPSLSSVGDGEGDHLGLRKDNFFHISLSQYVQDVFHLVCGRESISYSRIRDSRFSFKKNPDLLVHGLSPGTINNFSKQFLTAGRVFRRLSHFAALHFDDKLMDREGLQRNVVFISFLKFISDYLKLYETSLMLMAPHIKSLGKLSNFFKPFYLQLETLEHILDLYVAADQITLLKGLNSLMLLCEIPCIADLLRGAFITCACAYFRYVSDWIFRGALTEGFHIQTTKSCTYHDRRYWVKQFSQVSAVPAFLESIANIIFETGKAVNLLNLIRNSESSSSVISCILRDEYTSIQPKLDFEDVAELESEWKVKLDSFFEEFSFLKTDIEAALESSGNYKHQSPSQPVNFEAIEEAKVNFERQREEFRRQALDRKIEKQKSLYNSLNMQMMEKKNREKNEKEAEKIANEKIASYIAEVDKRDLDEEIRLMKKHFGNRLRETVGVRNVRNRIANTGTEIEQDLQLLIESATESISDVTDHDAIGTESNGRNQKEHPDIFNSSSEESDIQKSSKVVRFDDQLNECIEEDEITDEISPAIQSATDASLELLDNHANAEKNDEGGKETFDSNNLKLRSTIPFKINLDSDFSESIFLPKSNQTPGTLSESVRKQQGSNQSAFYLSNFLSQSVAIPAKAQNRMVNAALLHYFIVEKQLFQNLEALNDYLCLQNGMFGHFLTKFLVNEVNEGNLKAKEDIPKKIGRLNEILGETLTLSADGVGKAEFRDKLAFILSRENVRNSVDFDGQKSMKSKMLTSKYEVLDEILLNYSVDWPLSILLTDDLLINYEKLFSFQMRLYRAEILLLQVGTMLKFKGKNSTQFAVLNHHRYMMLHFVRAIRHYINVTVIHCAWTELGSSFHRLNSLDKVYEGLVRHIKFVTTNCLLGAKGEGVKKLLIDQLTVIECFCADVLHDCRDIDWANGEEVDVRRFAKLDQKFKVWEEIQKVFIQVVYKLSHKGTYQKVSYFLQLFNYNGFFGNDQMDLSCSSSTQLVLP